MNPAESDTLRVEGLCKRFGPVIACEDICFTLRTGEALAIVGESGSGKSTLLRCIAGKVAPDRGRVLVRGPDGEKIDLWSLDEARLEQLLPRVLSLVVQNPRDGLRFGISAGGNIAEPLLVAGASRYASLRAEALGWLERVEIPAARIDDLPGTFSGGMQQRLQIARGLATHPPLMLLDEPTGGLDVSVQARLLDLLSKLIRDLGLAAIVVTHDLAVARLLSDRMIVMQGGRVVEAGLTDRLLDDPRAPYTQLLISSQLQV